MGSALDELLAAIDLERRTGDGRVRHQVDGERGDVGRADHSSDRQRRLELVASCAQPIAERGCRTRCVDEPRSDHVHADGCELGREALRHRGERSRDR